MRHSTIGWKNQTEPAGVAEKKKRVSDPKKRTPNQEKRRPWTGRLITLGEEKGVKKPLVGWATTGPDYKGKNLTKDH